MIDTLCSSWCRCLCTCTLVVSPRRLEEICVTLSWMAQIIDEISHALRSFAPVGLSIPEATRARAAQAAFTALRVKAQRGHSGSASPGSDTRPPQRRPPPPSRARQRSRGPRAGPQPVLPIYRKGGGRGRARLLLAPHFRRRCKTPKGPKRPPAGTLPPPPPPAHPPAPRPHPHRPHVHTTSALSYRDHRPPARPTPECRDRRGRTDRDPAPARAPEVRHHGPEARSGAMVLRGRCRCRRVVGNVEV